LKLSLISASSKQAELLTQIFFSKRTLSIHLSMDIIQSRLEYAGIPHANVLTVLMGLVLLLLVCWLSHFVSRRILLAWIHKWAELSKASWDDASVKQKTFDRLVHLAPAIVLQLSAPIFLKFSVIIAALPEFDMHLPAPLATICAGCI
jgi:hypothetical protein